MTNLSQPFDQQSRSSFDFVILEASFLLNHLPLWDWVDQWVRPDFYWPQKHWIHTLQSNPTFTHLWGLARPLPSHHEVISLILVQVVGEEAQILALISQPQWQRRGAMTGLWRYFEQRTRQQGVRRWVLEVHEKNSAAQSFYFHQGFKKYAERQNYYQDGAAAWVFIKET